jgi:hypothetical protein
MFTNTRQSVAADNIIVRLYKLITSATGQLLLLQLLLLLTTDQPEWSTYPSIIIVEKSDRSNLPHKQRSNWLPLLQQQQHLCTAIRATQLLTKPCIAIVLQ